MSDHADLIDRYIAMWNETDPVRRRDLIARTWDTGASYVDPAVQGEGHAGIDAMVAAVQQRYPGSRTDQGHADHANQNLHNSCARLDALIEFASVHDIVPWKFRRDSKRRGTDHVLRGGDTLPPKSHCALSLVRTMIRPAP